jgi:hypothetical protein
MKIQVINIPLNQIKINVTNKFPPAKQYVFYQRSRFCVMPNLRIRGYIPALSHTPAWSSVSIV